MSRVFQIVLYAALSMLFASGVVVFAFVKLEPTLALISFLCMGLMLAWTVIAYRNRPDSIERSRLSVIGAHVQDTTTLAGSGSQFFGSLF